MARIFGTPRNEELRGTSINNTPTEEVAAFLGFLWHGARQLWAAPHAYVNRRPRRRSIEFRTEDSERPISSAEARVLGDYNLYNG